MKIVFWLDPEMGFDRNTPEILTNIADGLVELDYEVEILVLDHVLDNYPVTLATKRVYFAEDKQQIVTDILISNCLEKLLRTDLHCASERIWLVLEEDLQKSIKSFQTYHLFDVIRVITFVKKIKEKLLTVGIEAFLLQPSLQLDRFKTNLSQEKESWGVTLSLFESQPEIFQQVLQGVEMTLSALNCIKVYLLTDQQYHFKSAISIETMIKPSFSERLKIYERSDIVLHIPSQESFSLIPLESMALGVPVVVSQHSAIDQYAENKHNALVLDQITPADIALSILNIIKIGKIRKQLKAYGLQTARNYNAKKILQEFKNFLDQTISLQTPITEQLDQEPKKIVDIVIINHNSGQQIKKCLNALYRHLKSTLSTYQLIVVDNGSIDESLTYLKKQTNITLIVNKSDMGFAKACNQGILGSKSDFIIVLPSALEVTQGWLEPLLTAIKDPDVGVVLPQVDVGSQKPLTETGEQTDQSLEYMKGFSNIPAKLLKTGCLMLKRELLGRVGLYDERLCYSLASLDYLLRVKEKGYKISHLPKSQILDDKNLTESYLLNDQLIDKDFISSKEHFQSKWGLLADPSQPQRRVDGVVFLSLNIWRRKAQRTEVAMDYFTQQGLKVVYVEPYCAPTAPIEFGRGRYLYNLDGSGTIEYNLLNSGRLVEMMADLESYLSTWEITVPLIWVEAPWWESVVKHLEHLGIIYTTPELLLGEDMEVFQQLKAKFYQEEEMLLKNADLIICGSRQRQEELAIHEEKVLYSPGGFSSTDLERFFKGHFTMPDDLGELLGLKVGIMGNFNQFFPRQLLRQLAVNHPDVSFAFIGEITYDLGDLPEMPNLYFLGNKDWENLLDCIYFCDLVLYPYQDKNLNSYIDPYRINYYLAMGKPVIAFDHRELDRFGDRLFQAVDEDEFLELVAATIQNVDSERSKERSSEEVNQRINQIRGESWEQVFAKIFEQVVDRIAIVKKPVVASVKKTEPVKKNGFLHFIKQFVENFQRLFKNRQ